MDETKKEIDEGKRDHKVTMEIVQLIANSINPMIKFTVETLRNFLDGKMTILDIKVRINDN